jgi:hypothetical protein
LTLTVSGSVTLAQLELGSTATAYQRVVTQYDITEAGVTTLYGLMADGVDDGMVTPSIDFTGTDEVTQFAGVRKLSDAARGVVQELTNSLVLNEGVFNLSAPAAASDSFGIQSAGSSAASAISSGFASPLSAVLLAQQKIVIDKNTLRVNGTVAADGIADQGTGNYSNAVVYLFRRGGISIPFNGYYFGGGAIDRLTTEAEIAKTEAYLAAKTGVTL